MKGYTNNRFVAPPLPAEEQPEEIQPCSAKMLGSSIIDGRYNGVSDGQAGLLHGQYDNDTNLDVDPLCNFNTDTFSLRRGPSSVGSVPSQSSTPAE